MRDTTPTGPIAPRSAKAGAAAAGRPPAESLAAEDRPLLQRAVAQQQAGQLDDAEPVYRTLLAKQPRNAQIASLLGLLLLQRGRSREALAVLQPLIEAAVEDAALHNAHALALGALARFAEAAQAAGRAAALQPKVAELQINLGNALRKAGRTEEAQAAYRRASALRPELAAAQIGLGQAQAELGDAAAAIESYRNALSLQPQSTRAFYHWALALKGGGAIDPAVVERFAQRLADGGPSGPGADGEAAMLHTALGIVADKAGDYDSAFAHFQAGKAATRRDLERRGEAFDPAAHSRFIDALIAAFPDGGKPIEMAASARAIFVVGMPRSGTTLVEQILASHSKVTGGDELPFLPWLVAKIDGYPAGMAAQFPESLLGLAQDYLESLTAIDPAAERITDKLPLNFLHLGVIARLFPQATVVHCLRDPLDTCLSCFQQNIRAPYTCDLAELGLFYREYRRLMAHWRARLPLRLIEVSHEALVAEPEDEIRRLIGAAGLEWEEACLSFHTTKRAIGTASQMQVRQGISKRAIGRWRNYASHLQPLVTALGQSLP